MANGFISEDSAKALIDAGEIRVVLSFKKSSYPAAVSVQDLGHQSLLIRAWENDSLRDRRTFPDNKNIVEPFRKHAMIRHL